MNFKDFALTGRKVDCWFTQGECPGLGASAPSGREGNGRDVCGGIAGRFKAKKRFVTIRLGMDSMKAFLLIFPSF